MNNKLIKYGSQHLVSWCKDITPAQLVNQVLKSHHVVYQCQSSSLFENPDFTIFDAPIANEELNWNKIRFSI